MASDEVLLHVSLPATQRSYEFRVSGGLVVHDVARMMGTMLAAVEPHRFVASRDERLMCLDGEQAGSMLNTDATIREFVADGTLVDGSSLALV